MELIEAIGSILQKDWLAVALAVAVLFFAVFYLFDRYLRKREGSDWALKRRERWAEERRRRLDRLSPAEREKELKRIEEAEDLIKRIERLRSQLHGKDEAGALDREFLTFVVPAIIAIAITFTVIYLLVAHQADPNYSVPEELKSALGIILGYYFGIRVGEKTRPRDDIEELKSQLEQALTSGSSATREPRD